MQPLNWREKFAAIITLFIGILILALFVLDYSTKQSAEVTLAGDKIQISKGALFQIIRTVVAFLVGIIGGFALLKGKRFGWVWSFSFLTLIGVIAGYFTVVLSTAGMAPTTIAAGVMFLLILLSIIFLLITSTRQKFRVSSKTILPTLVFLLAIGAIFFFLQ
ncbi:hypothetical protein HHL16_11640 [Pseudoflavitalea sp. G-6-1-2]|uniref:hypothetical protein n=1 Tax=Pseudoflavitalea sp. G-6-1-2 TaxID=2728841 RepID=UPI00146C42AF|nr:hypothetical protein [Pseudoflavitalea sp. G-6-1-2]NML21531.1 hypothetical protein [Pseudoflavitalea sp. G-6-1-2]